jgi:preprotein translocase subunit YajC
LSGVGGRALFTSFLFFTYAILMRVMLASDICGTRFRDYGLFREKSVWEGIRMASAVLGTEIGLAVLWQQGGPIGLVMPLAMTFVLVYFFMVVPQRKQQRQLEAMRDALQVGDSVVTNGGIYGTITLVRDDKLTVQLRVANNPAVKINIARSAIAGLADPPDE